MIRLAALACGIICGMGLYIAGLFHPSLSHRFINMAEGWDPTLGVVLLSALIVAASILAITRAIRHPLLGGDIEKVSAIPVWKLVTGGVLFGLGWGLAGYFPSAAIVSLGLFAPGAAIFLASTLAGMVLHNLITDRSWMTMKGLRSGG